MRGLLPTACLLLALTSAGQAAERRFLLALGENQGAVDQPPLRYAEQDASAFAETMQAVGAVTPENTVVARGVSAGSLERTLAALMARLRSEGWGRGDLLVVYVSSHAAEGDLFLRGSRFPLRSLRTFVEEAPVGVAVLVVDTCNAAWVTQTKGLEPIESRTVTVEEASVAGRVFIASSGPTESAHESDRFGGSWFTGHLIAAVRGAADSSRDGRVTLQEAFAYAYNRTLESSLGARGGRQTPRYEMRLTGERDVVLSEPARGRGLLSILVERPGDWVAAPLDGDAPSQRFVKGAGPVLFAVSPGTWRVRTTLGDYELAGDVDIAEGGVATVDDTMLSGWSRQRVRAKGLERRWTVGAAGRGATPVVETQSPILPGAEVFGRLVDPEGPLGATWYGLALSWQGGEGSAELPFDEHEIALALAAGPEWTVGPFVWRAGLELGGMLVVQRKTPIGHREGTVARGGLAAGLTWPLNERLAAELRASGGP